MIPNININDYTYQLPEEKIARYPLEERDLSKLLVYKNQNITESTFRSIGNYIPDNALFIFNNTRVIRARLHFKKESGAAIEVFCLEPLHPCEVQTAFETRGETTWKCIVGNAKKWKGGPLTKSIETPLGHTVLAIEKGVQLENTYEIIFRWNNPHVTFADIIEQAGVTPIPPYLNRESEEIDTQRYQTVYSSQKGSVAAPTAGLHFTPTILDQLRQQGHKTLELTLHVGAGTFKPVQTEEVSNHVMHTEHFVVEAKALEQMLAHKGPFITVGTTSVRTVESLYWLGVKLIAGESIHNGITQWEAYTLPQNHSLREALQTLLDHMRANQLTYFQSKTAIMIMPGYQFRVVDVLVTNFHQPHSTLLLLIGAFIGEDWHKVYEYALSHEFRFLSYGDSSLLFRRQRVEELKS